MILLTGATGFVGAAVLESLKMHESVRIVLRQPILSATHARERVEKFSASLSPSQDWSLGLAGVSSIIHCAARVHVMREVESDPLAAFRSVNVEGTMALARQAAEAGVKRFVFISSVKVNGEDTQIGCPYTEDDIPAPQDAYGQSKYEAEIGLLRLAKETGMEVVIIRPPLIYGPGVKANFASLMNAVQHGWPLPLGAIHNQRSLVALDNLVDFILTCLRHPKAADQIFFVSDGHDLSTSELVRGMAHAAGVQPRLISIPSWALQAGASLLGKGAAVQRLCGNLQVDISKARNLLGWAPPLTVHEGLRRVITQAPSRSLSKSK